MRKDLPKILHAMRKTVNAKPTVFYKEPFQVLIATVLSQRTRDQNTAKASKQLFKKFKAPKTLSTAPLKEVEKLIRPAGFYKVKAKRIKEISRQVLERFGGKTPESIEELCSLPGVGRKTANCVLVYGFKKPAMPVDVHVHRISNRIGLVKTKTPEQTEQALLKTIPKRNWLELNHLMVKYGQKVCLPRNPRCVQCEIKKQCDYFRGIESKKQV